MKLSKINRHKIENLKEDNFDYKMLNNLLYKKKKDKKFWKKVCTEPECLKLTKTQKWYGSTIFGLSLDIPILSSGEQLAKINRAKIELEKTIIELNEFEKQLMINTNLAKGNYQFAVEDYYNKKNNLDLAKRIEKKNKIKFLEGVNSSFDLFQSQTQLYQSQQNYLKSMLNIINTKSHLETLLHESETN